MSDVAYQHVFSTFSVRSLTLRNRIVFPPIATNFAGESGEVAPYMKRYYERRAEGGTGLVIVENANVDHPLGRNGERQLRIDDERFLPSLAALAEGIKRRGAGACIQINHAGASTSRARTGGRGIVGPSAVPARRGGETPRPLSGGEICDIVEKFGRAAERARFAGFDAVEVHGGHSYLINQFLSPTTNRREDEFGGSAENRARFFAMVLAEVRRSVGPCFPVLARISADEFVDGGNTLADTIETLRGLAGLIDILDVSSGSSDSADKIVEPASYGEGWRVYLSAEIKRSCPIPTIAVGNIRTPEFAERTIAEGRADLVAIGRGLVCDPDWVAKVAAGEQDRIIRCVSCNEGCLANRIFRNKPIACVLNPGQFDA